jgi:hypothetical protein
MSFKLGKNTTKNLRSILKAQDPRSATLVDAVEDFIRYSPIDFCIIANGGYRTAEQQKELYNKGVSRCDGYLKKSHHQLGLAVDLVPWVGGKPTWETKHTFYLAGAFMAFCKERNLNITSGADWNRDGNLSDGWDPCHMQIG